MPICLADQHPPFARYSLTIPPEFSPQLAGVNFCLGLIKVSHVRVGVSIDRYEVGLPLPLRWNWAAWDDQLFLVGSVPTDISK